jgi:tetratricopeptide (TPR) repeat protein
MILLLIIPALLLLLLLYSLLTARSSKTESENRHLSAGIALFKRKEFQEAFLFFDERIKMGKKSSVAYLYRGLCHAKKDNLNSALYDLTTALSYDNGLADVYLERGKIYHSLGERDKASKEFERASFYSKGKRADILRYHGISMIEQGHYFQAARCLSRAVELGDEEANQLLMSPPFHNSFGFSKGPHSP